MPTGPGSFFEVTKILPLLTAPDAGHPSFHVIAPSLPGFAWSQAPSKSGFRSRHYAEVRTVLDKPGSSRANRLKAHEQVNVIAWLF